jgi:hypothetical protein
MQFVPHGEKTRHHYEIERLVFVREGSFCCEKYMNTQIHAIYKIKVFVMLQYVVRVVSYFWHKRVNLFM